MSDTNTSNRTRVIIVGCGIAGPVLATFLKDKGYEPVIYERTERGASAGLSLMIQVNGLRVLSLIPGIVENIPGISAEKLALYSTVPGDEGLLGQSDIPKMFTEKYKSTMTGVQRQKFLELLTTTALDRGVEIHWEQKVVDLEQGDDNGVRVVFENGHSDTASFVVGCDGLHSNTRISLFGKEEASYTGLTQTGGFSPTPSSFPDTPTIYNFFGDNMHAITYPISDTHYSWAISRREAETKETWRAVDDTMLQKLKEDPASSWGFGAGELFKNAEKIVKYGLYDRPELKTWYKGRVVLLGDAAHPTSPHIGQGANQAFEDVYHLIRLLIKYNPDATSPSTELLTKVFSEYESIRLPRTSQLVKEARKAGDQRVVEGLDQSIARNEVIRQVWHDEEKVLRSYDSLLSGPYTGQSEI